VETASSSAHCKTTSKVNDLLKRRRNIIVIRRAWARYPRCLLLAFFWLANPVHAQDESERLFWESVNCGREGEVRAYIEQFPNGAFIDEAIDCLRGTGEEAGSTADGGPDKIAKLLAECEGHIQANRLTSGAGGNALACYRSVLDRDPANARALAGLQRIEDTYARWARSAIANSAMEDAQRSLDKLRALNPEHSAVSELVKGIENLRKEDGMAPEKKQEAMTTPEVSEPPPAENRKDPQAETPMAAVRDSEMRHLVGRWKARFSSHYDGPLTLIIDISSIRDSLLEGEFSIIGNSQCGQALGGTIDKTSISIESGAPCAASGKLTLVRDRNERIKQLSGVIRITGLDQRPYVRFRKSD
jgi:hypothetical protein